MPTITVAEAWAQRPKSVLKTNAQGSRVKRIARGEAGRFTLYTEDAPNGVRVAGTFPLWYSGVLEPSRPAPTVPVPSKKRYPKVVTRDLVLTSKALEGIALAQRNMIRRAFRLPEVKSLEE